MADGTPNIPAEGQQASPAPADANAAPPAPTQSALNDAATNSDIDPGVAAMGESDEDFLASFLQEQGIVVEPSAPAPQQQQAPAPTNLPPPNGVPPGNGAPPSPTPGVDPTLLARMGMPSVPAAPAPSGWPAAPAWPAQPAPQMPAPAQQQPQPQQQQAPQGEELPLPFKAPFPIPPEVAAALEHEDPRYRQAAIGSLISAAGNEAFKQAVAYVQQNVAPSVASQTFHQVQRHNFQETVNRELYGNFPSLRNVHPSVIVRAAEVVTQDELARNPGAQITPETWKRVGALATSYLAQIANGQPPVAAPQVPTAPPGWAWNGQGWVPAMAQPQPSPGYAAPPTFISGQNGMPMSVPAHGAPTPESEMAAYMRGDWG